MQKSIILSQQRSEARLPEMFIRSQSIIDAALLHDYK
jgi:hypothetical protein